MKALGICGSLVKGGNTEQFLLHALNVIEQQGVEVRMIRLAGRKIEDCIHCNWCLTKQKEGHFCNIKDDMTELFEPLMEADILLLATPVYLGRLTGQLANFLDRIRCIEFGSIYQNTLKDKIGGALAVSWGRNAGVEAALQSLVTAFLLLDIIPVGAHMSPYGAAAVSSIHGAGEFNPEDRLQVLKDQWGLSTVEMVAKRAVKLAKIMQAGKRSLDLT